jgi:hypothetical protein
MTPLETVKAARELISDPACWTTGTNARNSNGKEVLARSPEAVCWCPQGALFRCSDYWWREPALYKAIDTASRRLFGMWLAIANDTVGHSAALAILDAAIEELS